MPRTKIERVYFLLDVCITYHNITQFSYRRNAFRPSLIIISKSHQHNYVIWREIDKFKDIRLVIFSLVISPWGNLKQTLWYISFLRTEGLLKPRRVYRSNSGYRLNGKKERLITVIYFSILLHAVYLSKYPRKLAAGNRRSKLIFAPPCDFIAQVGRTRDETQIVRLRAELDKSAHTCVECVL